MRSTSVAIVLLNIFFAFGCENPAPLDPADVVIDYTKINTKEIVKSLARKTEWQSLTDICPSELVPEKATEIDLLETVVRKTLTSVLRSAAKKMEVRVTHWLFCFRKQKG